MKTKLKIIGLGNPYHGDEAVAIDVLQPLSKLLPQEIAFREAPFAGAEMLDEFLDGVPIIFLYAFESHVPVGSLACCSWSERLPVQMEVYHILPHDWSVLDTLRLAEEVGYDLPLVFFIGISVQKLRDGEGLSDALTEKLPAILLKLREIIESLLVKLS